MSAPFFLSLSYNHPMETLVQDSRRLFGIQLSARQVQALSTYERELQEWSTRVNLTAIRDPQGIRTKHFLDSLSCALAWKESPPRSLIDVGTGAGFPGLVLKIIHPAMRLTLVESVGKKANFCRHMVETLELKAVEVIHSRAEDLGHLPAHREAYEWAVARAVATLPVLVEYLLPLVRVGGAMIAQKGATGPVEAHGAQQAIRVLGGGLRQLIPVVLPGVVEERCLVVVDKVNATPAKYPRRPGEAAKNPL